MKKYYNCVICKKKKELVTAMADMEAEVKEKFGEQFDAEDCDIVCDDCYKCFTKQKECKKIENAKTLSPDALRGIAEALETKDEEGVTIRQRFIQMEKNNETIQNSYKDLITNQGIFDTTDLEKENEHECDFDSGSAGCKVCKKEERQRLKAEVSKILDDVRVNSLKREMDMKTPRKIGEASGNEILFRSAYSVGWEYALIELKKRLGI